MNRRKRIAMAAMLAVLVVGSVAVTVALSGKAPQRVLAPEQTVAPQAPVPETLAVARAPRVESSTPVAAPKIPVEQPIEEILAESGEDPGAVYYMSRVREAIREGNPTFARELLRQMKEEHASSVLIEEAEALFEGGKRS